MYRSSILVVFALLACTALSSAHIPTHVLQANSLSTMARQSRRDRIPIEDELLLKIAANGLRLGRQLRRLPFFRNPLRRLVENQSVLAQEIQEIRRRLSLRGPGRVRGAARRALIRDEDILFAQIFLNGLRIDDLVREATQRIGILRTLDEQRKLALLIIQARFGTFPVFH